MLHRVLIVDDDIGNLALYTHILQKRFEVEIALSAENALGVLRECGPFDVIVSDMCLTGMDGIQFLARAREQDPDCVRIMMSGYADLRSVLDAVNKGGIFRLLTKPIMPDDLVEAVMAGVKEHERLVARLPM